MTGRRLEIGSDLQKHRVVSVQQDQHNVQDAQRRCTYGPIRLPPKSGSVLLPLIEDEDAGMGDGVGAVFNLLDREDKHRVRSVNTGAVLLTRARRYRNELGFMIINSCG
jgi:hypothetical protein